MKVNFTCKGTGPIVMVDDSKKDRFIAKRCFMKSKLSSQHEFVEFEDGRTFLDFLELVKLDLSLMPSLVLLDIKMPGMDGFEVLARIRAEAQFKAVPILVMFTSSQNTADIQRAEGAGANSYQTKPFQLEDYVSFFDSLAA